jgi:CheY-like chemotaxis protein
LPQTSSIRVLLVEDEALVRDLIEAALEETGHEVMSAADGAQAMAILAAAAASVGALVTDINLGAGVRGWDVALRARELRPGLPVIYVTGDSAHEWPSRGVPGSELVLKPFALTAIGDALARAGTGV